MPKPTRLSPGTQVAAVAGHLRGADAFDRLVVVEALEDGTYTVARLEDPGHQWRHVKRRHLTPISPTP